MEDSLNELESVKHRSRRSFVPIESKVLAGMGLRLVGICDILGNNLRIHYSSEYNRDCRYAQVLHGLAHNDDVSSDPV